MRHPLQECDSHGNTVQERVEQAMDEIKDRRAYLEKRGRSEVSFTTKDTMLHHDDVIDSSLPRPQSIVETSLHTLEPASMVRQVSAWWALDGISYIYAAASYRLVVTN